MEKILLFLLALFFHISIYSQYLVINEIMSNNCTFLQDEFGDFPDWIELYNGTPDTIHLLNYSLTDEPNCLDRWSFPEVNLPPFHFLLVFASGKDSLSTINLHTNFKISAEGETLILSDSSGIILDVYNEVEMETDISYGRLTDGQNDKLFFYQGSPSFSNNNNIVLNELTASHPSGFYSNSIDLEIYSSKPQDEIHFTLVGSEPTPLSSLYEGPLELTNRETDTIAISNIPTTPLEGPWQLSFFIWKEPESSIQLVNTIRFRSFTDNSPSSKIHSKTYLVHENIINRFEYPVISLMSENNNFFQYDSGIYIPGGTYDELGWNWHPNGNYMNNGIAWERTMHVEFFENDGSLQLDQDCGVRIHGGWSAIYAQKSLRLIARNSYGNNYFTYHLFEHLDSENYDNIVLRNSGNDFIRSHFRDAFMQSLLENLDMELQAFMPSVVFLNGEYWGIHGIRERYNEHYFKRHFNIQKNDLIVVNVCGGNPAIGNNMEYLELQSFAEENDLTIPENYNYILSKIDINNFIDYHIAEIYFGNFDWPCNNVKIWKTIDSLSKWRWLIYDLDGGFGYPHNYSYNNLHSILDTNGIFAPCCTVILRKLLLNESFSELFIDRFALHLNTTFHRDTVIGHILQFKSLFESEMPYHISRWKYPENFSTWENIIDGMVNFAIHRPCYCAEHVIQEFNLNSFGFICDTINSVKITETKSFNIFPNPAENYFFIQLPYKINLISDIFIISLQGDIKLKITPEIVSDNLYKISLANLPKGLYIIKIMHGYNTYFTKLMIK